MSRIVLNHISKKAARIVTGDLEPLPYAETCRRLLAGEIADVEERPAPSPEAVERGARSVEHRAGDVRLVRTPDVVPGPWAVRQLGTDRVDRLADSIAAIGLLAPPVGRERDGKIELACGATRLEAFRQLSRTLGADYHRIPVEVRDLSDAEMAVLAWDENAERAPLTPIEEAEFFRRLADEFGWTHDVIGAHVGLNRTTVSNRLRLLQLPEPVQAEVQAGRIGVGAALALASAGDPDAAMVEAARRRVPADDLRRGVRAPRLATRKQGTRLVIETPHGPIRIALPAGLERYADRVEAAVADAVAFATAPTGIRLLPIPRKRQA